MRSDQAKFDEFVAQLLLLDGIFERYAICAVGPAETTENRDVRWTVVPTGSAPLGHTDDN